MSKIDLAAQLKPIITAQQENLTAEEKKWLIEHPDANNHLIHQATMLSIKNSAVINDEFLFDSSVLKTAIKDTPSDDDLKIARAIVQRYQKITNNLWVGLQELQKLCDNNSVMAPHTTQVSAERYGYLNKISSALENAQTIEKQIVDLKAQEVELLAKSVVQIFELAGAEKGTVEAAIFEFGVTKGGLKQLPLNDKDKQKLEAFIDEVHTGFKPWLSQHWLQKSKVYPPSSLKQKFVESIFYELQQRGDLANYQEIGTFLRRAVEQSTVSDIEKILAERLTEVSIGLASIPFLTDYLAKSLSVPFDIQVTPVDPPNPGKSTEVLYPDNNSNLRQQVVASYQSGLKELQLQAQDLHQQKINELRKSVQGAFDEC